MAQVGQIKLVPTPDGGMSKKTPEVLAKLEEMLSTGLSITASCRIAGITEDTLARWRKDDHNVADLVNRAIGLAEAKLYGFAVGAATKDGRVAVQLLERRFPKDWSPQSSSTVNHNHLHGVLPAQFLQSLITQQSTADVIDVEAIENIAPMLPEPSGNAIPPESVQPVSEGDSGKA